MANSIFIPIVRIPSDINEVRSLLATAFDDFDLCTPKVWTDSKLKDHSSLTDVFIMIEGSDSSQQCWASINRCTPDLSDDPECEILVDVKTRMNWIFAGIVAYGFCKYGGHVIHNDAGELDGQHTYSLESLRNVIFEKLRQ